MTDSAFLDFWAFSDFTDGTREAPKVVGPAYEVTRWYLADDGKTYVMWDRLRYYHTSSENTAGRGWVYYEGLVNGGSEYDGRWYLSTRHADALMESIIFVEPNATVTSSSPASESTVGIGTTTLFVFALILWIIQPR
ncbi:MAG: hypothetical protein KF716_30570 [Anaerolineae bacterium]|nr:hypothetical protein [Anaerolineae bacterium]